MLPNNQGSKKEKQKKGFFSFLNKNKKKEKSDSSKINSLSEETINNSSSTELEETSTSKTQESTPNKGSKTILLIGRTGKGKSTLANVLTGRQIIREEIITDKFNQYCYQCSEEI